jgi:hypothetical protein
MSQLPRVQKKNTSKRSGCDTINLSSKRRRALTPALSTELCELCRSLRIQDVMDLSWETLQSAGLDGHLLGTRLIVIDAELNDNIVTSCALCRLIIAMLDRPVASFEALQIRAYLACGNTRDRCFQRLPETLKSKDIPLFDLSILSCRNKTCFLPIEL